MATSRTRRKKTGVPAEGDTSRTTGKEQTKKSSNGNVLTLTGVEQYSILGYKGNPILRWTQVTMNDAMTEHLLRQTTRDKRTKAIVPVFQEGVVERPHRRRATADELMARIGKTGEAVTLDPNDAG